MAHGSSRLTPHGRRLLVRRVLLVGWRPALVAEASGVSRATVYKWLRRFRDQGAQGLHDRSSRPKKSPRQVPEDEELRIVKLRKGMRRGPNRLAAIVGRPASTVYAVLRRNNISRLRDFDRVSRQPIRYVRERPGELVHIDVKKLGRIPRRGGHRFFGRALASHRQDGLGYDFVHVAVDDASRLAFAQLYPNEGELSASDFVQRLVGFYAQHGIQVERLMTDQHPTYRLSRRFAAELASRGIQHRMTRPYRPRTNGKAERFIQTLLDEWAYSKAYRSNLERQLALPRWLDFYNRRRPHSGLGDRPPMAVVDNVRGDYT